MKNSFFTLRGFLILGLMLLSAESFAQRQPSYQDYEEGAYDEQTQDGGEGMPCDDPRTIGEANRSAAENACWENYGRAVEDEIRMQREAMEEAIRRNNEFMRRSEERGRRNNGNPGFGRDPYDW
jgi:hypothetical protein